MKNPLLFAVIVLLFLHCNIIQLNGQTIDYQKTFGGIRDEYGMSIKELSNGNYLLFGSTRSFGHGNDNYSDFFLLWTDPNGDSIKARLYGNNDGENGISMDTAMSNTGYILGGNKQWANGLDYYVVRVNNNGDTLWTRTYAVRKFQSSDMLGAVLALPSGNFIVAGYTTGFDSSQTDIWILKLNPNGDTIWTKRFGGAYNDEVSDIAIASDGGLVMTGTTFSYGPGAGFWSNVLVIKTDSNGQMEWMKHFGGGYNEFSNDILPLADGTFLVAASTGSYGKGMSDVWLLKLNASGDTLWGKTFGGAMEDQGRFVNRYGSGIIIGGMTYSYGSGNADGIIYFTDQDGKYQKMISMGGLNSDELWKGQETSTGKIIAIGNTNSMGTGMNSMYLVRVSPQGTVIPMLQHNPASLYKSGSQLHIKGLDKNAKHHIRFFREDGRLVFEKDLSLSEEEISAAPLPKGILVWEISNSQGIQGYGKVIID